MVRETNYNLNRYSKINYQDKLENYFMSEDTSSGKIKLIDATAKFQHEQPKQSGSINIEDLIWDEQKQEEIWQFSHKVYDDLSLELTKIFDIKMPDFDKKMFSWVEYETRKDIAGDFDPLSGRIRLSATQIDNELAFVRTFAHELIHFASITKLFSQDTKVLPARVGISLIGNPIAKRENNSDDFNFQRYSGNVFNEAITEILASELINKIKDKYDFIPPEGIDPHTYANERRLFGAVIDAIVISWNNSEVRNNLLNDKNNDGVKDHTDKMDFQPGYRERRTDGWKSRIKKIQEGLGWQEHIEKSQVIDLFANGLSDPKGITKIASLLNVTLGEQAFQKLWQTKIGDQNSDAWDIIRPFLETTAYKSKPVQIIIGNQEVVLNPLQLPENLIFTSYQDFDGEKLSIEDIFQEYNKLLSDPLPPNDLLLFAMHSSEQRSRQFSEYPFSCPVIYEQKPQAISRRSRKTLDFCFNTLMGILKIKDVASSSETKEIMNTIYETQFFESETQSEILIAKVSITKKLGLRNTEPARYFFVKKQI